MLGLGHSARLSLVAASGRPSLVVVPGLLTAAASCCRAWALGAWASVGVACALSRSMAFGIISDQGSNQCPCTGRQVLNHWPQGSLGPHFN